MPVDTGYNESGVVLPSLFGSPGQNFQNAINLQQRDKERQQELEIQKQRQQDSDEWRKLGLIQDLTDLSKHQTGSDVANAIGNKKAADTLQKYTALAKTMSPSELQARINQDMSGLISGMTALKDELNLSEEGIKQIKAAHPDLDIARLAKDMRTDVLQRRLAGDNEFRNPLEVPPSQMRFTEPDVLANYVQGTKNLDEQIINPKGLEAMEVLSGSPNNYTKYKGKVPFWMKENFDRTKFNNGFYTGDVEPQLQIKSSVLPSKALPSSQGKPFEVIDEDVYQKFAENANTDLELTSAAMKKFPTFGKFTTEEKELAKRNVLFEKIKALDKSGYYPTEVKTPSASMLKLWMGGSGSGQQNVLPIDLREQPDTDYGKDITSIMQGVKVTGLPDGKTLLAENVQYDPVTKRVKYKEYVSQDEQGKYGKGQEREVSLVKFKQDIKTNNPGIDMKFLDGLDNAIVDKKQKPEQEAKKDKPAIKKITVKGL